MDGKPVNRTVLIFGIGDTLGVVQSEIAGEHVAGGNGYEIIVGIRKAEQLKGDEQGGKQTVGHSAEHGDHAYRRTQRKRQADQTAQKAAEGRTDKQGGHDLAAPVACGDGQGGKENFQQEGVGDGMAVKCLFDDGNSGAQIILGSAQEGQQYEETAARHDAQIGVLEKVAEQFVSQLESETEQDTHCGAAGCEKHHL